MKYLKIYQEFNKLKKFTLNESRKSEVNILTNAINKFEGETLLNMGKHFTIMLDGLIKKYKDEDPGYVVIDNEGLHLDNEDLYYLYSLYEKADVLFYTNSVDSDFSFDFREEYNIEFDDDPIYREDLLPVYREILISIIENVVIIKELLGEESFLTNINATVLRKINQ